MIVRAPRPESHFVQIRNEVIRDRRLSYKARGLLAYMLSFPDHYRITADSLAESSDSDGRRAVLSGLDELREAGYLVTVTERDAKGQFSKTSFIYDDPQQPTIAEMNGHYPKSDYAKSQNRTINTEHLEQNTRTTTIHHSPEPFPDPKPSEPPREPEPFPGLTTPTLPVAYARVAYSPDYEQFWKAYPRRVGKKAAYAAWRDAIREIDPGLIIAAAERYASDPNREDQFTAHPQTWLRQGRWDDDPLPGKTTRQATGGERRMDAYAAIAARLGQPQNEIGA
jgi:hypothetical protein